MVNNCLFLENVAETTAAGVGAFGGAIGLVDVKLMVVDSIFKKNKAIQADTTSGFGGGGAIYAFSSDVLVLSSVFELNEASETGGVALFATGAASSFVWYNNKVLGNDAGEDCDGAKKYPIVGGDCFNVTDNFSL